MSILGILISLSTVVYTLLDLQKDAKVKKMKYDDFKRLGVRNKKRKPIGIGDPEKIRLNLAQAGNPLSSIGLDEYSYYPFKIIFASLSAASAIGNGFLNILIYSIMGFFVIDVYIRMKKKKRHRSIKAVLGQLITVTIDGLQSGQTPMEITTSINKINKNNKTNPLWLEIKLLNMNLLKGNLAASLDEFRRRIDLEEIDNYCFSLLQYEIGGRAVTMLKLQLDLIQTLKANREKRETQAKGNLSSVAVALLVVALLMLILLPLMSTLKDMPMLQ